MLFYDTNVKLILDCKVLFKLMHACYLSISFLLHKVGALEVKIMIFNNIIKSVGNLILSSIVYISILFF